MVLNVLIKTVKIKNISYLCTKLLRDKTNENENKSEK
jgi:hypothetical protein